MRRSRPELEPLFAASPSATTAIWLELAARQAARRRPADLMAQRERDGFVQPSMLDQRLTHRLDGIALDAADEMEALLLSPVAPLGVCSVLAPTSQNRTLSAVRATEVVSDPTNVLAVECARRLTEHRSLDVRLCTAHQVLRAQALPDGAGLSRHFRLFAMGEAGPGRAEDGFEVDAVARHLRIFDRIFDGAAVLGCTFPGRRAIVRAVARRDVLAARVVERLRATLPHVEVVREPLEQTYYDGLRVLFGARAASGDFCPIGDLGLFDWVARLTSDRRLRFVASGLGIQLVPLLFRTA